MEPNWLDLPQDVTLQIFIKVGVFDLLGSAQFVCSSWRAIAKDPKLLEDPQLYCIIDMRTPWSCFTHNSNTKMLLTEKMATHAISRSRGHLLEFCTDHFCTDTILCKLMHGSSQLRCLRLGACYYVTSTCLIELLRMLPLLEEIEFCLFTCRTSVIEAVGRFCPKLKSFRLIHAGVKNPREVAASNEEAFAIAGNVNPGLRNLLLFGNLTSNDGLEVILDRFSQLEYLDLRRCFHVNLSGDLLRKCRGIKKLRLPNDSIEDHEFDAMVYGRR